MKTVLVLPLMAGCFFAGCDKPDSSPAPSSTSGGNPVTAPVDYLGAVAKAKKSADTKLGATGLEQAIKLFHAQEGRFPRNLGELLQPDFLTALPAAPAGMKFSYDPTNGTVKLVPQQGPRP